MEESKLTAENLWATYVLLFGIRRCVAFSQAPDRAPDKNTAREMVRWIRDNVPFELFDEFSLYYNKYTTGTLGDYYSIQRCGRER